MSSRTPIVSTATFLGAVFHALTCAGVFFGYNSLARLMSSNEAFASFCNSSTIPCEAQQIEIYQLFSYGSLCALIAPFFSGLAADRYGPRVVIRVVTGIFLIGILLLYFAIERHSDSLYLPAILCIGTAASSNLIPLFSVANLFPKNKSLAISVLSGSFDAGSVVFLVMGILFDYGFSLQHLLIGYMAGPLLIVVSMSIFLWPNKVYESIIVDDAPTTSSEVKSEEVKVDVVDDEEDEDDDEEEGNKDDDEVPHTPLVSVRSASRLSSMSPKDLTTEKPVIPKITSIESSSKPISTQQAPTNSNNEPNFLQGVDTKRLSSLSLFDQIRTPEYYLYAIYFSSCMIRFNCYLSNLSPILDAKGQTNQEYSKIFSTILPAGALVVFGAGWVIDKRGPVIAFYILSTLAVIVTVIELSPVLELQPIAFVSFAAFRAFQFAAMSSYLAIVFGFKNLSGLIGLVTTIGGIVGYSQRVFTSWGVKAGGFVQPNSFILLLMLCGYSWPLYLSRKAAIIKN